MILSPQQEAAVKAWGQDVCVVAGPGSGKTRVLTERFRWLVEEKGFDPRRILAITFTDKAATEIKRRLVSAFAGRADLREPIERAWVSTVHGFCARLLREHAVAAGVDPEFQVMDETDQSAWLKEAAAGVLDSLLEEDGGQLRSLLRSLPVSSDPDARQPDLAQALVDVYGAMRVAGKRPADLPDSLEDPTEVNLAPIRNIVRELLARPDYGRTEAQRQRRAALNDWLRRAEALPEGLVTQAHFQILADLPCDLQGQGNNAYGQVMRPLRDVLIPALRAEMIGGFNARNYAILRSALRRLDDAWRVRKRQSSAVDFDDLEEGAIRLLREDAAVARKVRESFDAVLMDELQDTNPLQWALVDLLRSPDRFFAVGDVNQSIFGFRHAEPAVFGRYQESLTGAGKAVHKLLRNYRSRKGILTVVNRIFEEVRGVEKHSIEPSDRFSEAPEPAVEIVVAGGATSEEASEREARWIARRILELRNELTVGPIGAERPVRFSDFAVLARAMASLAPVHRALQAVGIPALVTGGRTFFETREVRDLIHWLAVLANPRDEIALAGLLRSPLVGVSDEALLRMCAGGRLADGFERLDSGSGAGYDAEDLERLLSLKRRLNLLRPLAGSTPPDRLCADALDEAGYLAMLGAHGRANVEKFTAMLREAYLSRPRSLRELLHDLENMRDAGAEAEAPPGDSADAVRLMSIHKSKGLEFPVVFVASLQRRPNSSRPVICFDPDAGLGLRWRDPAGTKSVADSVFERFDKRLQEKQQDEEDRLLYVAMTRAEERLVLSFARTQRGAISRWVPLITTPLGFDPDIETNSPVVCEAGDEVRFRLTVTGEDPGETAVTQDLESLPEPEILARPEVTGQHDSAVSVTSVALFQSCPRKFYLSRHIGWSADQASVWAPEEEGEPPEDRTGELDPSELGRQVHALLADELVPTPDQEAVRLADGFRDSALGERLARAVRYEKETGFLIALEDVVLRGQIDLWFEEGGELVLVDYKTDRANAADEDRLMPYRLQLQLYAIALERMLGRRPDVGFLHLLRTGESVPVEVSREALEAAAAGVRIFSEAQNRLVFPLREGKRCWNCEFHRGACPAA